MGQDTAIEWADHTFNPWWGCTAVSPACDHCYAEALAKRTGAANLWKGERRRTSEANWNLPLKWNRQAERDGRRFRVFCASMADVFDNQVDREWRDALWRLIGDTPHLDWLLLTKRPQNIPKFIPDCDDSWPWPNVWLGTTVENQTEADRRIPHLLAAPAAMRFLSCEPLLGPIELQCIRDDPRLCGLDVIERRPGKASIDWVIAGGESGPNARPSHPDWFRQLRDVCAHFEVPFFFKQWGEFSPVADVLSAVRQRRRSVLLQPGGSPVPEDVAMRGDCPAESRDGWQYMSCLGKKAAGRLLDGRTHDAFPAIQVKAAG